MFHIKRLTFRYAKKLYLIANDLDLLDYCFTLVAIAFDWQALITVLDMCCLANLHYLQACSTIEALVHVDDAALQ